MGTENRKQWDFRKWFNWQDKPPKMNFKEIKENYSDIETMEDLEYHTTVLSNFLKICNSASCNHENHKMFKII